MSRSARIRPALVFASSLSFAAAPGAADFAPEFRVYSEIFLGETAFPTHPEVDEIAAGGLAGIAEDAGGGPGTLPTLSGLVIQASVSQPGTIAAGVRIVPAGLGSEPFGLRGRFARMAVPDDSSAYVSMGAGIDATTATRIGISTSMSLVVDAGGVASGTLAIIESDGDPLTLSLETVALSAAEAAAIETGASFVLDVTVDVESGTAAATVDVAGFPTRSTPTLALTLASPTDRVDGLAQVLGTSDLTGAPSSVEFESFEVFRIFDFTTSFTVDTLIDATDATIGDALCDIGTGACSLRAAIQESNAIAGPGEIHLPSGLYVLGLVGTDEDATATGDLDVLDDLVLRGGGRDSTVVDAAGLDRVFELPPTARSVLALLHDLEITGGDATTATSFSGGGIRSTGHLVMERCVVSGSDANRAGGILALGPLQVEDCIVRGNRVGDLGFVPVGAGGIEVRSIGGPAWATIRSTAVIESDGVNASGIVFVDADPSKIENSTISDNRGDQLEVVDSDVEVVHSTLVARTENALAVQLLAGSHTFTLRSSAVDGMPACDLAIAFPSIATLVGTNASSDSSCGLVGGSEGIPLGLSTLAPIGNTIGQAPAPGGPLVDTAALADCPTFDQAGAYRPLDGDLDGLADCDIGAIEVPEPRRGPSLVAGLIVLVLLSPYGVRQSSRGRAAPLAS